MLPETKRDDTMDISKNTLEVIRVQRTEYRGKDLVDFRLWVQSDEPGGEYIPTKKGISFRRELLGEVSGRYVRCGTTKRPPAVNRRRVRVFRLPRLLRRGL